MTQPKKYEVIIIGGSYAGLSAAMALGRSLRSVLVIDAADPCNKQTPHSHNFVTQDGEKPSVISQKARDQVGLYPTVQFIQANATHVANHGDYFLVATDDKESYQAQRIILATGIKDIMPDIPGIAAC